MSTVNKLTIGASLAWIALLLLVGSMIASSEDIEPPRVQSFAIEPSRVSTVTSSQVMTFTAHITDETGMKNVQFRFSPQVGTQELTVQFSRFSLVEGTLQDGTHVVTQTLPIRSTPGLWDTDFLYTEDTAGNWALCDSVRICPFDYIFSFMNGGVQLLLPFVAR